MLAVKLEDIERGKFDRSLAKHQICQYFPPDNKLCYTVPEFCNIPVYLAIFDAYHYQ